MIQELPKDIREKLPIAKKVLEQLVFGKFNIPFDIKTEYSRYNGSWSISIWVDIDVDRYCDFTTKHDVDYENHINNLDRRVENTLGYVDLRGVYGGLLFDYINDDETDKIYYNLQQKLYAELENKFNARRHEVDSIYYYLYKSGDEVVYFRTEFVGDEIQVEDEETGEMSTLVSCDDLYTTMLDVYNNSGITFDVENFICQ